VNPARGGLGEKKKCGNQKGQGFRKATWGGDEARGISPERHGRGDKERVERGGLSLVESRRESQGVDLRGKHKKVESKRTGGLSLEK